MRYRCLKQEFLLEKRISLPQKNLLTKFLMIGLKILIILQIFFFGLSKHLLKKKLKNFDEAFRCFEKSQLNLKYENTNPKIFQNYIHTYRKNIDNDAFLQNQTHKIVKNSPVFLIGFPRSGTTLLDTILRSHPEIDVLEEKPLINSVEQIINSKFKCSLDKLHKLTSKDLDYLQKSLFGNSEK